MNQRLLMNSSKSDISLTRLISMIMDMTSSDIALIFSRNRNSSGFTLDFTLNRGRLEDDKIEKLAIDYFPEQFIKEPVRNQQTYARGSFDNPLLETYGIQTNNRGMRFYQIVPIQLSNQILGFLILIRGDVYTYLEGETSLFPIVSLLAKTWIERQIECPKAKNMDKHVKNRKYRETKHLTYNY